jgi:hypothetical protein
LCHPTDERAVDGRSSTHAIVRPISEEARGTAPAEEERMLRSLLVTAVGSFVFVACSATLNGVGASCFITPAPQCPTAACHGGGATTSASCVNGLWECPAISDIACEGPLDAGGDCAGLAQPSCSQCGVSVAPTCQQGGWVCPVLGVACAYDGGTPVACSATKACPAGFMCGYKIADACSATGECFPEPSKTGALCSAISPACSCAGANINVACTGYPSGYASAPVAYPGQCGKGPFACGAMSCDAATQYCKIGEGGAGGPDGGANASYSCEPLPAACAADHTCTCVDKAVGGQLCSEKGGTLTVTFEYP